MPDSPFRWRSVGPYLWWYVRTAPWTFAWLALLFVTTMIQRSLSPRVLRRLLETESTNIANLHNDPLRVLLGSLLWVDGRYWFPYLFLFCFFHAPAERWLGSLRWAVVGLSTHVIASYFSEGVLDLRIHHGMVSHRMVDVRDIGVSYFLVGIIGVLAYRIVRPWRWWYMGACVVGFGIVLAVNPTFTPIGHFSSLMIGFAWYPITRGVPGRPVDPAPYLRWGRRRIASVLGGHRSPRAS